MRIAIAANRASGGGLDPQPLAAAMRGAQVQVFESLDGIAEWRPDRLAVAGGDGSIAAAAELAGRLDVPLAVIPSGTANDFARAHGLPEDPREAAALAAGATAAQDLELGRLAGGRPFVNVASAGLASVAARRAQPLKHRLGAPAYAVGAVRAAATARPLRVAVRVDGETAFDGGCWQIIVAVSGAFGGGSGVAEADPGDGVLDVVVLPAGSRLGLARRAWGLRTQRIARQRGVRHLRGRVIEVTGATELNVDGEVVSGGLERVTVEPRAFRLLVPEGRSPVTDATDGVRPSHGADRTEAQGAPRRDPAA